MTWESPTVVGTPEGSRRVEHPTATAQTRGPLRTEPVETVEWHTGGEPFRIVPQAPPAVTQPGLTVAERRTAAMASDEVQWTRALLCGEPRGHADMYGAFLVPPDDAGAHLGALFWHKDGFSTACGHGTIALGAWAVASGLVPASADGTTDVVIDVPSGRVTACVRTAGGRVADVTFINVPGYVHARGVEVTTSHGPVAVDIAFGGAMYAVLPAARFGLRVRPEDIPVLVAAGREIRDALNAAGAAGHPEDPRLSGVYGTVFTEEAAHRPTGPMAPGGCTTAMSPCSRTVRSTAPRAARAPPHGSRCSPMPGNCGPATNFCTSRWWDRSSTPGSPA